jgi:hypothetical protein
LVQANKRDMQQLREETLQRKRSQKIIINNELSLNKTKQWRRLSCNAGLQAISRTNRSITSNIKISWLVSSVLPRQKVLGSGMFNNVPKWELNERKYKKKVNRKCECMSSSYLKRW